MPGASFGRRHAVPWIWFSKAGSINCAPCRISCCQTTLLGSGAASAGKKEKEKEKEKGKDKGYQEYAKKEKDSKKKKKKRDSALPAHKDSTPGSLSCIITQVVLESVCCI